MDKALLADIGQGMAVVFCANNNIREPAIHLYDRDHPEAVKIKRVGTCGYYRNQNIHVAIYACASNNPAYSWPGFISDRTPYGVVLHELGHHIDQEKSFVDVYRSAPGRFFSDTIRAMSKEPPITSYAPNTMEWFAEMFRLFVTNPDLLKRIRPITYKALIEKGLKPIVPLSAEQIMTEWKAPERVFERMQKWIEKSK